MPEPMTARARYEKAAHAMQSGVAMMMNYDPGATSPKHLRVGMNSAMVENGALVQLLIDKGLITADEWWESLAKFMEAEAESYRQMIQTHVDGEGGTTKITLA